jgi:magnesium-transporting ATPase (P-type)
MVRRIVEPIVFGFLFVIIFWLSERNKNPERKVDRGKMRFWMAFATWMTCAEFASLWHNQIGSAWQNHPDFTVFGTLIVFAILNAVAPPLHDLLTMFPDDGTRRRSQERLP